jgi:hypothetical protein
MIQIKLIGMSMNSYYAKVHLSKCNSSWVVSKKKLWILTFKRPPCSYSLFLTKMILLKVVHPLKIFQYTKFHGPMLTRASFVSTSEVWTSEIWNAWRYGIKKYGVDVIFNDMTYLLNLIKIYQLIQKLLGGTHRRTGWWSYKPHFPF